MMRPTYSSGESWTPGVNVGGTVRVLVWATAGAFVAQSLWEKGFGLYGLTDVLALSWDGIRSGMIWQLATYMFLHGGIWHLLMNLLGLAVFGRDLEESLGPRRFLRLFLGCGLLGGLGWLVVEVATRGGGACVGASGAVYGLLGAFAALFPNRTLVLFPIPIAISARTLALVSAGIALFMSVTAPGGGIAHSAHLVGGVAGYLYGLHVLRVYGPYGLAARADAGWTPGAWFGHARAWLRRKQMRVVDGAPASPADVDRILDKIVAEGIGSLTEREKETLRKASRSL